MQTTYQLSAPTRVTPALAATLARRGHRRHFADGESIQRQGDDRRGFWLIEAGQVRLGRYGADGDLTVFGLLGPGDLFGELAYFAEVTRQVDAVARGAAVLIWIDAPLIDALMAEQPDFALTLLRSLAGQLRRALDGIDDRRQLSAEARLAKALLDLAARDGAHIACTQQELADLIGASRVTTGQILARLAGAGIVERGYRRLALRDPAALRRVAGG